MNTDNKTAALSPPAVEGFVLVPCHYCGEPCREVVLERGGDNGWGDDKSRTVRKYAVPVQATGGELRERVQTAIAILAERMGGNPARSPAHNARLILEDALATCPAIAPGGDAVTLTAGDLHWFEDAFRAWECGDFEGVLDGLNRAINHFAGAGK